MRIGIFTRTFERPSLAEKLDAVRAHGLDSVQLNLSCAGLPDMPDEIAPAQADRIRSELEARQIALSALSGTFNIIHPDAEQRRAGMRRLRVLAAACERLGTSVITLSTGTRNRENMWRHHPDNATPEAWSEMVAAMREIAAIGAEFGVTMAFEPEVSNVVDSAQKARRLLDTLQSPYVRVVMDGANIFHAGELPAMREILEEAFALLGPDIALAHAKDLTRDGEAGNVAAGKGLLDYTRYLQLLQQAQPDVHLILHGLDEQEVAGCVAFLRNRLASLP